MPRPGVFIPIQRQGLGVGIIADLAVAKHIGALRRKDLRSANPYVVGDRSHLINRAVLLPFVILGQGQVLVRRGSRDGGRSKARHPCVVLIVAHLDIVAVLHNIDGVASAQGQRGRAARIGARIHDDGVARREHREGVIPLWVIRSVAGRGAGERAVRDGQRARLLVHRGFATDGAVRNAVDASAVELHAVVIRAGNRRAVNDNVGITACAAHVQHGLVVATAIAAAIQNDIAFRTFLIFADVQAAEEGRTIGHAIDRQRGIIHHHEHWIYMGGVAFLHQGLAVQVDGYALIQLDPIFYRHCISQQGDGVATLRSVNGRLERGILLFTNRGNDGVGPDDLVDVVAFGDGSHVVTFCKVGRIREDVFTCAYGILAAFQNDIVPRRTMMKNQVSSTVKAAAFHLEC